MAKNLLNLDGIEGIVGNNFIPVWQRYIAASNWRNVSTQRYNATLWNKVVWRIIIGGAATNIGYSVWQQEHKQQNLQQQQVVQQQEQQQQQQQIQQQVVQQQQQ